MYLVETGRFTVERDGVSLAEIGAGSVIGEIGFLTGGTRTADVIAARNSVVLRIDRRAYDLLCATTPGLQQAIAAELAGRLAETSARVVPDPGRPRARTICLLPSAGAPLPSRFAPDLAGEMVGRRRRAPDHRGRFQARPGRKRRP
jgi:NTE family protein